MPLLRQDPPALAARSVETGSWTQLSRACSCLWPSASHVTIIRVMSTTTSLAHVKAHLSAIVGSVHDTHERVVITRNGEPAAVLVSPDDLASLEETVEILSSRALMTDLAQAREEIESGQTVELTERPKR